MLKAASDKYQIVLKSVESEESFHDRNREMRNQLRKLQAYLDKLFYEARHHSSEFLIRTRIDPTLQTCASILEYVRVYFVIWPQN